MSQAITDIHLEDLPGIRPLQVAKLKRIGINSVLELAVAIPQEIAEESGSDLESMVALVLEANETLSKIVNVTYFLHPIFDPSVISSKSPKDRFAISFTGWGFFNLKAKVYFKDGKIQDLSLPIDKWKVTL